MGLFDRITGKSEKSVDYWELKRILDVENDLDKRCNSLCEPLSKVPLNYIIKQ